MKRYLTITLFLSVLSLSSVIFAADPIIGTWKEKSVNDPNVKEAFIMYKGTEGGMIEFSTKDVLKDGNTDSSKWLIPKEGGIVKCLSRELEEGLQYIAVFPDSNHLIISIMKDGRQVAMYDKIISKDGRELTQKLTGRDREGKNLNVVKVYEKQ